MKGEPLSPEVHLPHLHRRCLLQLLPSTGPDDTSEPAARLRLVHQLLLEVISKHFNIIEKNGEFDELQRALERMVPSEWDIEFLGMGRTEELPGLIPPY